MRHRVEVDVRLEPVGVVAIASAWNLPVAMPARKIAPALAFGNAAIRGPADLTPAYACAPTEIIARRDIPRGVFDLVAGFGRDVGRRLDGRRGVDAIGFAGAVPVGRGIAAPAIANMTKIQIEMGSENTLVMTDDADIDLAVTHAAGSACGGTGQRCTAASRPIVHEAVHDRFVAVATAMRVGRAPEDGTQLGPVVSEGQLAQNLAYFGAGRAEGPSSCAAASRRSARPRAPSCRPWSSPRPRTR